MNTTDTATESSQPTATGNPAPDPAPIVNPASRHDPALRWFAEARLGMFIHWGIMSGRGSMTEQYKQRIPPETYERMGREIALEHFSAAAWVDAAEALGARYLTLVAKHTDGFCLWDTETTDFKLTNSRFGRDLVAEVAEECHRRGMRFCCYISPTDFHCKYYDWKEGAWGDRQWSVPGEERSREKYIAYLRTQVTELVTRYGQVDGIWFDASDHQEHHWDGRKLYELIKEHQPQAVVNDRAGYGDFLTPEQKMDESIDHRRYLVEYCSTVTRGSWAYNPDVDHLSVRELVDRIVRMAGCGANSLLNVGPMPDGRIHPAALERLRGVGDWMRVNGEAIHGTEALPLDGLHDSLHATCAENRVYLHLREWPRTDRLTVPGLPYKPRRAVLLGGPELAVAERDGGWVVEGLPAQAPDGNAAAVRLEYPAAPEVHLRRDPVRTEHVVPVRAAGSTPLPVTLANCDGVRVKGFRHKVTALVPPDAAFTVDHAELGWTAGGPRSAICDWRALQQTIAWHLQAETALPVRLRICLRCPEPFGGSTYEVRCGDAALIATIRGNPGTAGGMENCPDWWRGFRQLPFVWEEVGELTVPAGRSRLILRPLEIPCGIYVADVAGVELRPCRTVCDSERRVTQAAAVAGEERMP